jgi:hypothetical protein
VTVCCCDYQDPDNRCLPCLARKHYLCIDRTAREPKEPPRDDITYINPQ